MEERRRMNNEERCSLCGFPRKSNGEDDTVGGSGVYSSADIRRFERTAAVEE
jgi:hypothetical protein